MKAENAAVRELLRRMEEQQKTLLDQVDRLQRRLDGGTIANGQVTEQPSGPANVPLPATNAADAPASTNTESAPPQPAPAPIEEPKGGFYDDGIVIWQTDDDAIVPFQLKFTNTTQVRYLNTLSANETFTDHLRVVREVHKRNDITVNRSMFVFNGYVFDKRARYNLTFGRLRAPHRSLSPGTSAGSSTRRSRSPEVTRGFPPADRSSTRSHFLPPPTGPWLTTSSGPASRKESGQTENR